MQDTRLLLIVDVQKGFITSKETQAIIPQINKLVAVWEAKSWPVVASRFTNLPNSNWQRLRDWAEMQSEPDTLLAADLQVTTPYIFKKGTYSAWSDEVASVCNSHRVREVAIVGVDTNECVLATAIALFDAGLTPLVVEDCCASSGGPKSHTLAIELMRPLLGEQQIVQSQDLLN